MTQKLKKKINMIPYNTDMEPVVLPDRDAISRIWWIIA